MSKPTLDLDVVEDDAGGQAYSGGEIFSGAALVAKMSVSEGEDASISIINRMTSPICSISSRDGVGSSSMWEEEEYPEHQVDQVQRWWRRTRSLQATAEALEGVSSSMSVLLKTLDSAVSAASFPTSRTILQNKTFEKAVAKVLASLPRSPELQAFPYAARSTRAFISALFIQLHPREALAEAPDGESLSEEDKGDTSAAGTPLHESPPAKMLRAAAALFISSMKALCEYSQSHAKSKSSPAGPTQGGEGASKGMATLAVRVGALQVARCFFAAAFIHWQKLDAERVAAQLIQPYARAYAAVMAAMASGDTRLAAGLKQQLGSFRSAIEKLIGKEKALHSLQEVEAAVEADMVDTQVSIDESVRETLASTGSFGEDSPQQQQQQQQPEDSAARLVPLSTEGGKTKNEVQEDGAAAAPAAAPVGAQVEAVPKDAPPPPAAPPATATPPPSVTPENSPLLANLLGNARLAHEIILNPAFKLPEEEEEDEENGQGEGVFPERGPSSSSLVRRTKLHHMAQALLPSPPHFSGPTELKMRAKVLVAAAPAVAAAGAGAAPGGASAAGTAATTGGGWRKAEVLLVTWMDEDGDPCAVGDEGAEVLIDVRMEDDGSVEKGVSYGRIRKDASPQAPDYSLLLNMLEEVRDELIQLTPNNARVGDAVRAALDTDLLRQMLRPGSTLGSADVSRLVTFIVEHLLGLQAPVRSEKTRKWLAKFQGGLSRAAQGGASQEQQAEALVLMLPRAFDFFFSRIDEVRRDMANYHIQTIVAPYLKRNGADFERNKFEEMLKARGGDKALVNMREWLRIGLVEANASGGGDSDSVLQSVKEGKTAVVLSVLQLAWVQLLRRPVRLSTPGARLPESLEMDGERLAAVRDTLDSVALTATLCVLLRQVMARLHCPFPVASQERLQHRLMILVTDPSNMVRLPQLVEEVVSEAKHLFLSRPASTPPVSACAVPGGAAPGGAPLKEEDEDSLRSLLRNSADPDNEVFKVFFDRTLSVVRGSLGGGGVEALCVKYGLKAFEKPLGEQGDKLRMLYKHNLKVFATHYSRIMMQEARALLIATGG